MVVKIYLAKNLFLSIYRIMQSNTMSLQKWHPLTNITNSTEMIGSYLLESSPVVSFYYEAESIGILSTTIYARIAIYD